MSATGDLMDAVPGPDRSLCLWSALASLSALLFCLLVVTPAFELDDDIRMATIASGEEAGGLPDHHLIFTSSLIGGPLSSLYLLAPDVPWYSAYLYSIQFVAWTCLLRVLLAGREFGPALAWFAILFLVVGVRLVANVQFTTTAWLLGLAGVVLGLSPLLTPQRIGGATWVGPALLGCATLIRFDASVLIVCLAALPLLALSSERWVDRGRRVLGLGLAVVVAIVVWKVDIAWNYATPEWREFFRFHAAFSAIYDYQLLESIGNELELARRVGWSPNDLKLLGEWNYLDNTVYTTDRLVQFRTLIVTEGLPEAGSRWQRAMFWSPYLKQLALPVVAANLLVLLLPLRGQVGRLWLLAAAASVAIGSLLLFGLGRFPPHVALPTALTPPLLVSLLANGGAAAGRIAPRQALLLIAVVAFGIWSLVPVVSRGRDLAFRRGEFQKLVAALPDGETAVLDVALADRLCALPLSPFPRRLTERLFSWGWHIRTPTFVERANRAGVPLEHVDMVDRPVSFVMRPEILGAIQLSLLEHHGIVTRVAYSGHFGQLPAYRLERVDIPDRAQ
jgi:hypothetical protein